MRTAGTVVAAAVPENVQVRKRIDGRKNMAFASYEFILVFLPVAVIGYFLMNQVGRTYGKLFLVASSVVFYGYAAPMLFLVVGVSILINWGCYRLMRSWNGRYAKGWMCAGVSADILLLFIYKYYNFFLSGVNQILRTDFVLLHLVIPLGISFFTFSQLSFLIDGYRREFEECSFIDYALYVLFFPKMVSGPIVGFAELSVQYNDEKRKRVNWSNIAWGIETFILGLGKKVLLADVLNRIVDYGFENPDCMNFANSLIVMLCFTFEIYFDFSGYSDMAVGISKMMNFDLPVNFNSPYRALNIKEFWERWHITLTSFLTKYVYIPLGGNRRGKLKKYRNIMIVFLVSGIWHGANMTFVAWGAMHGLARCLHEKFAACWGRIWKVIQWACMFLFLNVTWFIFRAGSLKQVGQIVSGWKFSELRPQFISDDMLNVLLLPEFKFIANMLLPQMSDNSVCYVLFELLLAACFVLVLGIKNNMVRKYRQNVFTAAMLALLLSWCVVSFGSVQSFIYESF